MSTNLRKLTGSLLAGLLSVILLTAALLPVAGSAGVAARTAADYWSELPEELVEPPLPQGSVLLAADGKTKLATLFLYNREVVPLGKVAPVVRTAIVAIEDSRFYDHTGIDVRGIARAAKSNLTGGAVQGASTLTQQYVKNTLLLAAQTTDDPDAQAAAVERSAARKLREAKLALAVDRKYAKDVILGKYLNIAYFGSGAYGVQAAAKRYFGVPASDLTLPQAALLAGLVKNPTGYDPLTYPDAALERRNIVLARMLELGEIDDAEYQQAAASPLRLRPTRRVQGCATGPVPFYCDWVRRVLENDPSMGETVTDRRRKLLEGGLVITTALDMGMQTKAQRAVNSVISNDHRVAASSVVVEPGTGRVQAMAVNRRYGIGPGETEMPLPTTPAYQPGSTFKAFTLTAALEAGIPITTRLPGGDRHTSRVFDNPSAGFFTNSADGEGSNLTVQQSMAMSVNTAFVQLMEKVGTKAVARVARRAGVTSIPVRGPGAVGAREGAFTLGSREVSPLEMAGAYATFAARGVACPPVAVVKITDRRGRVLPSPVTRCRQAFSPAVADTVTSVLAGVMRPGGTGAVVALDRPAAGKTGTTQNSASAWFVGYTPQLATAVAMADPRGPHAYPLHDVLGYSVVYGGTLPGQIWRATMTSLLAGKPKRDLPTADPSYIDTAGGPLLPSLTGQRAEEAAARLSALGLRAESELAAGGASDLVAGGVVLGQVPAAGSVLRRGDTVTLRVSR